MIKMVEVPFIGQSDKICDQIIERILDEYVKRDPKSRLNMQALGSHGMLMIGGTVDSRADFDVATLAQSVYRDIGFDDDIEPFVNLERPSEDLSRIFVKGGAQGTCVVHGYATKETREFLPKPLVYARSIARRIDDLRRTDAGFSWLRPDGKVQIAMNGSHIFSVAISVQHSEDIELTDLQNVLLNQVVVPVVGDVENVKLFINSGGVFTAGGFSANSGASGRKNASDTYGGLLPVGDSSLIGKDALHPSRCGQYMARFVAKNLVQRGLAGNVFLSVAYATGRVEPVVVRARSGTGDDLTDLVVSEFDFRPEAIVERLNLLEPMYARIAAQGQFGHSGLPWEESV